MIAGELALAPGPGFEGADRAFGRPGGADFHRRIRQDGQGVGQHRGNGEAGLRDRAHGDRARIGLVGRLQPASFFADRQRDVRVGEVPRTVALLGAVHVGGASGLADDGRPGCRFGVHGQVQIEGEAAAGLHRLGHAELDVVVHAQRQPAGGVLVADGDALIGRRQAGGQDQGCGRDEL
jgi:hypothetical protein